ncbi:MAG: hypothetical protein RL885_12315 [Planctomycetota bacterium]
MKDGQKRAHLYCHCAYAKVIDPEVKRQVLRGLSESDVAFEAVPDLCEMSARKDPTLARLSATPGLEITACYPRAVRWLFHAAGHPLPAGDEVKIHNMREESAEVILERVIGAPGEKEQEQEMSS